MNYMDNQNKHYSNCNIGKGNIAWLVGEGRGRREYMSIDSKLAFLHFHCLLLLQQISLSQHHSLVNESNLRGNLL